MSRLGSFFSVFGMLYVLFVIVRCATIFGGNSPPKGQELVQYLAAMLVTVILFAYVVYQYWLLAQAKR